MNRCILRKVTNMVKNEIVLHHPNSNARCPTHKRCTQKEKNRNKRQLNIGIDKYSEAFKPCHLRRLSMRQ